MAALELTYLACSASTGAVVEELPALTPTQPLGRRLGLVTTATYDLALPGAPAAWEAATDQGRTLIVAVDKLTGLPIWSGVTLVRAGGSATTVQLSTATPEAYLDRRYPGTYSASATDMTTIMAALATPALTSGLALTLDTTASGTAIDYAVQDGDDKTILSCLQSLSSQLGAPELTVDTVWADAAQTAVQLVLRIKPTIGIQSATPNAVFDQPGCIADYLFTESYEAGKGATTITAEGEGEGSARVMSPVQSATTALAAGWPRWDYRWTPTTGITSVAQLTAYAQKALALMGTGTAAWTVNATASVAPRLGRDWALGDALSIAVQSSPRHPNGASAIARAYGWDLDPAADRVTPILLEA